jgi:ABC-2 type transport system permease protein
MALIAVERMKLTSTRAPWWSALAAVIAVPSLAAAVAASTGVDVSLVNVVGGYPLGLTIVMAMAALAITTEYNFGTIRTTFLASPSRSAVLWAKALVVAIAAGLIGLISAFASWGIAKVIRPSADLGLSTVTDWRQIAGLVPVFALAGIVSVAAGILIRRTAGAVALVVLWPSAVEPLVGILPGIGADISQWLPFTAARNFLTQGDVVASGPGPWVSLAYFAAVVFGLMFAAVALAKRRDA